MEFEFTKHAIDRIEEYKVSFKDIIQSIYYPDRIEKRPDVYRFLKIFKNRNKTLISVCAFQENKCRIVTIIYAKNGKNSILL